MLEREKTPYGYIYKITNTINGKVYIGKTEKTIEERWSKHLENAKELKRAREANPHEKKAGTHIDNTINKYGSDAFNVNQEDVAYSKVELNEKERNWVKEYDSMNPDKGYNMTEGGEGGRQSPEVIKKMTEINQEIARNLETLENLSKAISEKWQDQNYQKNVSKGVTDKWQQAEYREKQLRAKTEGKRDIPDKMKFLNDIKGMVKKDINAKYNMDGKSINKRIAEMLGHHGVNNFSQAKKFLENKNLKDVLKDINKWQKDHHQKTEIKKEISNKREFLKDIQNMQGKEIAQKYDMNRSTINKRIQEMLGEHGIHNYADAKKYLENKNLNEVLKDINERLSKQAERYQGTTDITDKKQFIQDIQTMQKNEINYKYGMDAKTINQKMREMFGPDGPKNYTELKEYLQDKNVNDVLKEIEERTKEKDIKPSSQGDNIQDKGESKPQENVKEKPEGDTKKDEKEGKKEISKEDDKLTNPEKEAEVPDKEVEQGNKEEDKREDIKSEEKVSEESKQEEKDFEGIDKGISGEGDMEKKSDIGGAFEMSLDRGGDIRIKSTDSDGINKKTKEYVPVRTDGKVPRFTSGVEVIEKKFVNPPKPTGIEGKHSDFSGLNLNLNMGSGGSDWSLSGGGGGGGGGDGGGGDALDYDTIDSDDKETEEKTEQEGEEGSEGRERSWEV